jgi:molybdopterin converting factor small subunit
MATLRLFGPARLAAGEALIGVNGGTVGEVLAIAEARFGGDLAAVVANSKIWVNGTAAALDDLVGETDEVSVIPPVSGG